MVKGIEFYRFLEMGREQSGIIVGRLPGSSLVFKGYSRSDQFYSNKDPIK